jgi:alpha-N-arabinofuranosidase
VTVQGDAPQPEPRYPVGYNHPKVRAGSPTYPLDVIAGMSPDGKTLRIGVVNPTLTSQTLKLDLKSLTPRGAGRRWVLSGASLKARNKVGAPAGVTITPGSAPRPGTGLTVSAISATVFEFPIDVAKR